ncbi:hypothetical protein [Helicobacter sp. 13S00477-4]|uniref:hypothetical protein n=1 Tax=Helicobacter sp. 13S00477-4 TaxID=1905759 RepID=UPI000BA60B9B|nr:hypothetical protein [Helicobacter sp. 13S00477-4]PAF51242.1 hypothetical protein BKH44_05910 [Helicobacter sp. 13S00477-4]
MDISIIQLQKNEFFIKYKGKIKTYHDFLEFKEEIDPIIESFQQEPNKTLEIFFINTYPMNSYAIGYLLKLKENDEINIKISTNDYKLINLFKMLGLDKKFEINIKQIE